MMLVVQHAVGEAHALLEPVPEIGEPVSVEAAERMDGEPALRLPVAADPGGQQVGGLLAVVRTPLDAGGIAY